VSNNKKVLLEDYTGPYCGNCPPAADTAAALASRYSPNVIVIAVHAGYFAYPHGTDYPGTFTTSAGEAWDAAGGFGISANKGNPNGMVNRKAFPGKNLITNQSIWPSTVPLGLVDPFKIKLDITTRYDTTVRALNTDIKAKFITNYNNNVMIQAVITEDGIEGHQKDYSINPPVIENYEFEHVLRGSLNGDWGAVLKSTPIAANDTAVVSIKDVQLNSAYNDKKVTVVVFAYDAVSKEVIQVEKVKIR
jgi:hypothetical protein